VGALANPSSYDYVPAFVNNARLHYHAAFKAGTLAAVDGKGLARPNSMQKPYVRIEAIDWEVNLGTDAYVVASSWPVVRFGVVNIPFNYRNRAKWFKSKNLANSATGHGPA
jgi:hypothetical protein